jgi:CBS domain-containing protein
MRPLTAVHPVDPNLAADAALELMGRENVDQLPVIANGRLEGIVTRSLLIRQWRLRRQSAA